MWAAHICGGGDSRKGQKMEGSLWAIALLINFIPYVIPAEEMHSAPDIEGGASWCHLQQNSNTDQKNRAGLCVKSEHCANKRTQKWPVPIQGSQSLSKVTQGLGNLDQVCLPHPKWSEWKQKGLGGKSEVFTFISFPSKYGHRSEIIWLPSAGCQCNRLPISTDSQGCYGQCSFLLIGQSPGLPYMLNTKIPSESYIVRCFFKIRSFKLPRSPASIFIRSLSTPHLGFSFFFKKKIYIYILN